MKKKQNKYIYYLLVALVVCPATVFAAEDSCKQILGTNTLKMVKDAYNILRFAVPIALVGFSTMDFIKAITSQKADELQTAIKKFTSRLIIGLVILVLPTILYFILNDILGMNICKI
ncbi:MAG: hypothetical protein E7158_03325 [Firmicutes bacterium]|nr:hypothetical protein [Bacillota bacterium]